MPYPSKKFHQNPFTSLRVIRRTDRQTDKQTDRQTDKQTDRTKNITSFFGRGNNTVAALTGEDNSTELQQSVQCMWLLVIGLLVSSTATQKLETRHGLAKNFQGPPSFSRTFMTLNLKLLNSSTYKNLGTPWYS